MKGLTDKTNHQSRVMGRIWILVITGLGLLTTVNLDPLGIWATIIILQNN